MRTPTLIATFVASALAACATSGPPPATGPMSFFVTSAGSGKGADLGGLAGAVRSVRRAPLQWGRATGPGVLI